MGRNKQRGAGLQSALLLLSWAALFCTVLSCAKLQSVHPSGNQGDGSTDAARSRDGTATQSDADNGQPDAQVGEADGNVAEPDASKPDAGAPDASTPDAMVEVDSICDRKAGLWCHGFEGEAFTRYPGTDRPLTVDASDTYHGAGALLAQSSGGGQTAPVAADFTPTHTGELYMRAYLKVPASVDGLHTDIFSLHAPATADASGEHCAVVLRSGGLMLWCIADGAVAEVATPFPRDRWVCVEWKVVLGTPGSSELFFDGSSVASGAGTTMLTRPYEHARAGIVYTAEAQTAVDIRLDELMLATEPVGCD